MGVGKGLGGQTLGRTEDTDVGEKKIGGKTAQRTTRKLKDSKEKRLLKLETIVVGGGGGGDPDKEFRGKAHEWKKWTFQA